ncbi:MAG: alpha/beta fold hydrolase [Chloroflexi bacterium]|nr:alpha/beta fold hydrolase [Chloroflexota bacterium]
MPAVRAGAVELHYRDDGAGHPALFIQGLGVDHRGWSGVTRTLSSGMRCISYDNRDIGRSSLCDAPYDIIDLASDAVALLDALEIPRADIVGVSMGGGIAQELAIRHPARVRRLVLASTYTSSDPRGRAIFTAQSMLRATLEREAYLRATLWSVYTHEDYRREGLIEQAIIRAAANDLWQPQDAYERQVAATLTVETEDRLGEIAAPALIINGSDDILTPMRFAQTLARGISGSRLSVVEGAGHGMIWSHTEAVTQEIRTFLQEGAPAAAK